MTSFDQPHAPARDDVPRETSSELLPADRRYERFARLGGSSVLLILCGIGLFLVIRSGDALSTAGLRFLVETTWSPNSIPPVFGVASLMFGTVLVAGIALLFAVPLAIGCALFLTEVCPIRFRKPFVTLVDLLAAIPSLIFGLWGLFFMAPRVIGFSQFLTEHFSWIPFFETTDENFKSSIFMASLIVAVMTIPICTSVMREVFAQTPPMEKEAALALGGTRWGMIRTVVLPFGKGGIIGGAMLGLGRALGETIAVAILFGSVSPTTIRVLGGGGSTIASMIALTFGEASEFGISALMAAGLALFVLTLVVNLIASSIVSRSRSGAGVEI